MRTGVGGNFGAGWLRTGSTFACFRCRRCHALRCEFVQNGSSPAFSGRAFALRSKSWPHSVHVKYLSVAAVSVL